MKITRRSPRIKIGNTTYTFGKNGVSSSTKIARGIRLRRSANGKQSIGGSILGWRWFQDLDELGRKKSTDEIKQIREQRKNELSLGLFFTNPIVFFDHLFRRNKQPIAENMAPQNQQPLPQSQIGQSDTNPVYTIPVSIFKESNGALTKVTEGTASLENDRILVKANVTKEILYTDISDVHTECGKVFISSKMRNIPLVLEMGDAGTFVKKLIEKMEEK